MSGFATKSTMIIDEVCVCVCVCVCGLKWFIYLSRGIELKSLYVSYVPMSLLLTFLLILPFYAKHSRGGLAVLSFLIVEQ